MDNDGVGGGSKADAAAAAEAVAEAAVAAEAAAVWQAENQNCDLRQALSTDVSWQLAKDADGPDRKMKNTRKFGFSEYVLRTRNRINMIRNGHRESNHNTFLRHSKNEKKYLDNREEVVAK